MDTKQNKAEFEPSAIQLAFVDAYSRHRGNISKACGELGDKGRNRYYGPKGWNKQEGFDEWLSEYAKKEVLKRRGKWYLIAEKYAEAGSYKHLELLMSLANEFDDNSEDSGIRRLLQQALRKLDRSKDNQKDNNS